MNKLSILLKLKLMDNKDKMQKFNVILKCIIEIEQEITAKSSVPCFTKQEHILLCIIYTFIL